MNNNVDRHLLKLTGHPNPTLPSFTWDLSHCLELAGKDSRRAGLKSEGEHPYIAETFETMRETGRKWQRGKGWKELKDMAKKNSNEDFEDLASYENQEELAMKQPRTQKPFCQTRFTTYLSEVIDAHRVNYPLVYKLMSKNDDGALIKIADVPFILRMNGLYDFYEDLGSLSRTLQRPDIFTWQIEESIDDALDRFANMRSEFLGTKEPELTKNFHNAVAELSHRGSHKRCPIPGRYLTITTAASEDGNNRYKLKNSGYDAAINDTRKELASHVESFSNMFLDRVQEAQPQVLKWTRNVFALRDIVNRPSDCCPRWLNKLYNESKLAGLYEADVSFETVEEEYHAFVKEIQRLHDVHVQRRQTEDGRVTDQTIYMEMLRNPSGQPHVMDMLASSIGRTYCEAITEGIP